MSPEQNPASLQDHDRTDLHEPRHEPTQRHGLTRHLHWPTHHASSAFGDDLFGRNAERFARFFGTPAFLLAQTAIVGAWTWVNIAGVTTFDPYPFILLNLMFSLQAAYAAPLILLAQTRQADRDKLDSLAEAHHREALAEASTERQTVAAQQTALLIELMKQNTELTELTRHLSERIEAMTKELHSKLVSDGMH